MPPSQQKDLLKEIIKGSDIGGKQSMVKNATKSRNV